MPASNIGSCALIHLTHPDLIRTFYGVFFVPECVIVIEDEMRCLLSLLHSVAVSLLVVGETAQGMARPMDT